MGLPGFNNEYMCLMRACDASLASILKFLFYDLNSIVIFKQILKYGKFYHVIGIVKKNIHNLAFGK